jgi:hypothetical protein
MATRTESDEKLIKEKLAADELTKCDNEKLSLKLKSDVCNSYTLIFDKKKEVYQGYVRCKAVIVPKVRKARYS